MNEADPYSPLVLAASLRLLGALLLAVVVAGAVTALTTVQRMRRSGLIGGEDNPLPAIRLLDHARSVLLTLSIVFLVSASIAAAEVPTLLRAVTDEPPFWLWGLGWITYFVCLFTASVGMKALALARPLGYTLGMRAFVYPLHLVLRPLTIGLEAVMNRMVPAIWSLDLSPPLSGSEIRGLLADEEASAHMEDDELEWARSVFELGETEIREIMVPRIDMIALEVGTTFEEALAFAAGASFTRLPVYEENPDRILGVLHTKDLLASSVRGEAPLVRELLRPVHFLPESKPIDEALVEFREGRIHLAVVVDEYGGTAGIVTLEDILEEIVGEIRDEFDQEGDLVKMLDPKAAVIDPRVDIDDLNELLGLELPADESDTLGGLLYQLCGRGPARGDSVDHEELRFTIDRVERQRIKQVTLRSPRPLALSNGNPPENVDTSQQE